MAHRLALPDVRGAPPPLVRGEPVEISDGVFVIPDNRVPIVPNVGLVVGDQAVLVIDTGLGPRNGAYVLDQARRLAGSRPLYLTVTHFHPEHGFGAQAFKGAAELGNIELADPDVTYDDRAEIDLGGRRAVLRSWGPAHTVGDQTVLIDDHVLFGGDLIETRMFPIAPYFPPHDAGGPGQGAPSRVRPARTAGRRASGTRTLWLGGADCGGRV